MQHLNSYFFLQKSKTDIIYTCSSYRRELLLTLHQLVLSAENFCKQSGTRPGPTKCQASSGSKLFDPWILFLKEFFKKLILKKISRRQKGTKNYPVGKGLKNVLL